MQTRMTLVTDLRDVLSSLNLDNAPTPERQEKSQFSHYDNVWRVRTIAERLYSTDRITQDAYNACQEWTVNYVLTYDGPGAIQAGSSTSVIKHDRISWAMDRAIKANSIPAIREFVGKACHSLLVLSLYECYNSNTIGALLLPNAPNSSRNKAVETMCIESYEALNEFYRRQHLDKRGRYAMD